MDLLKHSVMHLALVSAGSKLPGRVATKAYDWHDSPHLAPFLCPS